MIALNGHGVESPDPSNGNRRIRERTRILTRLPNLHDELDVNISEELIDFLLENRQPILEPLVLSVTPKHNDLVITIGANKSDLLL